MNTSSNEAPNTPKKKKSVIVRWIIGGFFTIFALINGFHYSSVFLLCAAFLMFPFPFMESFLQNRNIKTIVTIILSVILFFIGVTTSPPAETPNSNLNSTIQSSMQNNKHSYSAKPNSSSSSTNSNNSTSNNTTKPNNSSSNNEKVQMVWIASSGNKYHTKSNCSNMKSPRQISLNDAKNQGYTACKRCH